MKRQSRNDPHETTVEWSQNQDGTTNRNGDGVRQRGIQEALFFTVFFTWYIYFVVEKCHSGQWSLFRWPQFPTHIEDYLDTEAALICLVWFIIQCPLYVLPIGGKTEKGLALKDSGQSLQYRLNALFVLMLNISGFVSAELLGFRVSKLSEKLLQLTTAGVILILFLSWMLYIKAYWASKLNLNHQGNTGNVFYDWFHGRELNPRLQFLDLKYVCFRSGIIGWIMLNLVNIVKAYEQGKGHPTNNLILVFGMQLTYVVDCFWFENALLVSRDIVHEGLGYNLLVQFLMIPFCFIVQTRYLLQTNLTLPWYILTGIFLLYFTGYIIYRDSNQQKNNFRKNPKSPSVSHLESMPTASGKALLVGGWWGLCRHPNYLGDIIISISYALPTGLNHFLPYMGSLFLILLLIDRERRDYAECKQKYGADWGRYCARVKYRIVPYIY
ncbi:hypothetical protein CHS0354_042149 [Potamilus streckersoni]|uniref:Uncharacterized protein n=1 Tax=Potamilus streckersoni TaxID=2493646 RepID=A0AAE0TLJ0_9BIVA|nr:hypothetical protein CHS0354_042149 [Potamilus streckersoni]